MSTQKDQVRQAIKDLRESIKNLDGSPLTQIQFAPMIGVGLSTLQRYEQSTPPRGKTLAVLADLADVSTKPELADTFRRALSTYAFPEVDLAIAPRNKTEEFYEAVILAILRNPQYAALIPKFNKLAQAPIRECARRIEMYREAKAAAQKELDDDWAPIIEAVKRSNEKL